MELMAYFLNRIEKIDIMINHKNPNIGCKLLSKQLFNGKCHCKKKKQIAASECCGFVVCDSSKSWKIDITDIYRFLKLGQLSEPTIF
jgi:hypothetical protein